MSTPTTPPPTFFRPVHLPDPGRVLWAAYPIAVIVLIVVVLIGRRRFQGERERWEWRPNGSVRGPRWAQRRVRRALAAYALLVAWPGTVGEWRASAARQTARATRRVRRRWPDIALALGWPSRFMAYSVDPEGREILVRAVERPDPVEIARRLDELGVIAHASRVTLEIVDTSPSHVRLVIGDAREEPIVRRLGHVLRWIGDDGELVESVHSVGVQTGVRWVSLYDEDATWDDLDAPAPDDGEIRVIPTGHSPEVASRRPHAGTPRREARRREPLSGDNAPVGIAVISARQYMLLTALDRVAGGLTTTAAAEASGQTWTAAKRSLARMGDNGLVALHGDLWVISTAGADLLRPWPAPQMEGSS